MNNKFSAFGSLSDSDEDRAAPSAAKDQKKKSKPQKEASRKPATAAEIKLKEKEKEKTQKVEKHEKPKQTEEGDQGEDEYQQAQFYGKKSFKRGGYRGGYEGQREERGYPSRGYHGEGRGRGDRGRGGYRGEGRGYGGGYQNRGEGYGYGREGRGRGRGGRGNYTYKRKDWEGQKEGGEGPREERREDAQYDHDSYPRHSGTGRGKEQRKGGYGKYGTGGNTEKNIRDELQLQEEGEKQDEAAQEGETEEKPKYQKKGKGKEEGGEYKKKFQEQASVDGLTYEEYLAQQQGGKSTEDVAPKQSIAAKRETNIKGQLYEKEEEHIQAVAEKKLKAVDTYSMKMATSGKVELGFEMNDKWGGEERRGGRGSFRGGRKPRGGYRGGGRGRGSYQGRGGYGKPESQAFTEEAFPGLP